MFYYPAALTRHSGCFSTIWLVATKGIKVPRRDFLKVDVGNTCDDILNYVLERVPAPRPGLPRPRFSLYLSCQLQYGVVLVFHRQCEILLEEIQFIVGKLMKTRTSQSIDMDDSRQPVVLPSALDLLEEAEGAPDPLFGVMCLQDAALSPSALIQMSWEYLRGFSPERPEVRTPPAAAAAAATAVSVAAAETGITASQESITMQEAEPLAFPAPEFEGEDLDYQPEMLDFLLEESGRGARGEGERERAPVCVRLHPTVSTEEASLIPPEELDAPPEESRPSAGLPTSPVPQPGRRSPPPAAARRKTRPRSVKLEDLSPQREKTRKRRKQLTFFDPETQLSEEAMRQQINNLLTETRRPAFPSSALIRPAVLLSSPCCSFLPEDIEFLWQQAATITPLSDSDLQAGERGPESTDSEREREREREAEAALRQASETWDISAPGTLSLEGSDQPEGSQELSPVHSAERGGLLPDLPDLPELPGHEEEAEAPQSFHSFLPPDADRRTVSRGFHSLLGALSRREVRAAQSEPYGDIWISPGSNYAAVHLF
ncbi:meiotic recombination protein REC8 homolog [Salarias fasciatus]|uniref:meiotic recombination protein REC8 homolog n=1 Tax=Salarias fasciatus TaxID=181472 RepID=UPI001176B40C|nr:meiotic recombination protein REC8 homolog [Salarias fasciatus]